MGTVTYHKPVGVSAIDSIKSEMGQEWCAKHVIAATATREAVFLVGRFYEPDSKEYVPDPDGHIRTLLVFKLSLAPKSYYNFGYKDMTETMGPCDCEAPLSIIAQCSKLQDRELTAQELEFSALGSARNYRARCMAMAAAKATKRGLRVGQTITLASPGTFGGVLCQTFTVEKTRVRGRKGISTVFRAENGMLCGISARDLEGATIS